MPPGNLGNTREFDNYVQGPGNTCELKKIHGKTAKLLECKHFIPSIAKTKHQLRSIFYAMRHTGLRKLGKLTVA